MSSYEVTLSVDGLKVEYVGEALRRLSAAAESLRDEGLSIDVWFSVERDRDGIERWPSFVADGGEIIDVQPWEEDGETSGADAVFATARQAAREWVSKHGLSVAAMAPVLEADGKIVPVVVDGVTIGYALQGEGERA